jgi:3-oxoacyl-[acyl-carrier protein] reductase
MESSTGSFGTISSSLLSFTFIAPLLLGGIDNRAFVSMARSGRPMSFSGKHAVVTGAGGGIGLNVARDLLAAGAAVTMIDLKPRPDGLDEYGERADYRQGDLTDEPFVAAVFRDGFARRGRLDYLVNAAAVLWFDRDGSLVDIDLGVWDRVMAIDLKAAVHTCRHAVPPMRQSGGGAMVHVSSIQCLRGDPRPQDAYQAAKAGLIALSKSVAVQFARDGIRSNCILPGGTLTPLQQRWLDDPDLAHRAAERVPLGRLGTPQDMANACLFLLSDRAAFITGTELIVDGGMTALP